MSKYKFEIDLESDSTHAKIISLVGKKKSVLDIGCAGGDVAGVLRQKFDCKVCGLERDQKNADLAAEVCDRVVTVDVESADLATHFEPEEFDVLLFADVLEHLVDPKAALSKLLPFCKEYVVISVPNVSHASILYELLNGDFKYRELGLLDATHLRFFTKKTIVDLLEECGLTIDTILRTRITPSQTELETDLSSFPSEIQNFIAAQPESDTYQYVIRARKSSDGFVREPVEADTTYFSLEREVRDLQEEVTLLRGQIEKKDQTISWYESKLREEQVVHYTHRKNQEELDKLQADIQQLQLEHDAIEEDRDRCAAHAERLSNSSPEALPGILGRPLKALILLWSKASGGNVASGKVVKTQIST